VSVKDHGIHLSVSTDSSAVNVESPHLLYSNDTTALPAGQLQVCPAEKTSGLCEGGGEGTVR
jgi:hypothetical protein